MGTINIPIGREIIYALLVIAAVGLALALALVAWVFWKVRHINLPPGAGFMTALRATPLSVVLLLDALDLGLDIFSAPFSWIILTRLGLGPLRAVSVIKDLIPGTGFIPAMTVAWIVVRLFRPEQTSMVESEFRRLTGPRDADPGRRV